MGTCSDEGKGRKGEGVKGREGWKERQGRVKEGTE